MPDSFVEDSFIEDEVPPEPRSTGKAVLAGAKRGALGLVGLEPGDIEGTIAALSDPHAPKIEDQLPDADSVKGLVDRFRGGPLNAITAAPSIVADAVSPLHWITKAIEPLNPEAFGRAKGEAQGYGEYDEAGAPILSEAMALAPNLAVGNDAAVVNAARTGAAKTAGIAAKAAPVLGKVGGAVAGSKVGPVGTVAGWVAGGKAGNAVAKGLRKFSDLVAPLAKLKPPAKGLDIPAEVMAGDGTRAFANAADDVMLGESRGVAKEAMREAAKASPAVDEAAAQNAADEMAESYDPGGKDWQSWLKEEPAAPAARPDLEPAAKVYRTPTEGARPKFKGKTPPAPSTPEDMRAAALAEPLPPADMPADVMAAETPKSVPFARAPKITGSGEQLVGYVKSLPSAQRVEWIHRLAKDQGKDVAQAVADAAHVSLKLNPL
jgi:hypothetical protein